MKLRRFSGKNVYEFLNLNVTFNDDLTFLVGVNGSGKTTVLRLIHAILAPSLEELFAISFSRIELVLEDGALERVVKCTRENGILTLTVDNIDGTLEAPLPPEGDSKSGSQVQRSEAFLEAVRAKCAGNPVFEFLTRLSSPLFLGLERRHLRNEEEFGDTLDEIEYHYAISRRHARPLKLVRGSLGASLAEVQVLLQEAYRQIRRLQDSYASKLRKAVVMSAFKYTEFRDKELLFGETFADRSRVFSRESEIRQALQNIDVSGEDVSTQLDEFFSRLNVLFGTTKPGDEREISIEWLMNKAQVDRIEELIALIDSHKSSVDKLFGPVGRFVATINSFYRDSRKNIEVDPVGRLAILRPDQQKATIEALSSGERQILIIFGHLFFNKYGSRSNVFIIDEPELSLHLRWQEHFVERALSASPTAQLILATHSPEIVGAYKNKCFQVLGS